MLDWFSDLYVKLVTALPPFVFEERSLNFTLFRVLMGMLAITLILLAIAVLRKKR
jgi:hypothetical protein